VASAPAALRALLAENLLVITWATGETAGLPAVPPGVPIVNILETV
jgi:hypothetical protein